MHLSLTDNSLFLNNSLLTHLKVTRNLLAKGLYNLKIMYRLFPFYQPLKLKLHVTTSTNLIFGLSACQYIIIKP